MKKTSNILKAAIVLVLVAGFGLGQKSQAQQISHYTQTLLNPYTTTPPWLEPTTISRCALPTVCNG